MSAISAPARGRCGLTRDGDGEPGWRPTLDSLPQVRNRFLSLLVNHVIQPRCIWPSVYAAHPHGGLPGRRHGGMREAVWVGGAAEAGMAAGP